MQEYLLTKVIFKDLNPTKAGNKLRKVGISHIGRASRIVSTGELIYHIRRPEDGQREDIIKLSDKMSIGIVTDIGRTASPVLTHLVFNTSIQVSNTWMTKLGIEKIARGGGLRKGALAGWTKYRIAPKGSGRNKKILRLGTSLCAYIAASSK